MDEDLHLELADDADSPGRAVDEQDEFEPQCAACCATPDTIDPSTGKPLVFVRHDQDRLCCIIACLLYRHIGNWAVAYFALQVFLFLFVAAQ